MSDDPSDRREQYRERHSAVLEYATAWLMGLVAVFLFLSALIPMLAK